MTGATRRMDSDSIIGPRPSKLAIDDGGTVQLKEAIGRIVFGYSKGEGHNLWLGLWLLWRKFSDEDQCT